MSAIKARPLYKPSNHPHTITVRTSSLWFDLLVSIRFDVRTLKDRFCLSGSCDPDDLRVEDDQRPLPPPPPPQLPDPPQPEEEEEGPVINIEAELLWENQPHPPRGDVPNRHPLDYKEVEPRDPEPHSNGYTHHSSHPNIQQHTGSSTGNIGSTVRHGQNMNLSSLNFKQSE